MYSPINYMKHNIFSDYLISENKTSNHKGSKNKSNSLNIKKLILSRNQNISSKNLILAKTNNNNSYKKLILKNQISSDNTSSNNINKKANQSSKKKTKNFNKQESLYNYLMSKIKEKSKNISKINNLSNNNIKSKNKFNQYMTKDKTQSNKNYYRKILNFPLSPQNHKNIKSLKLNKPNNLNNLNLHEISSCYNYLKNKKQKDEIIEYNKVLLGKNLYQNKKNKINIDNIENSFIMHNTNNINLNFNIINKGIILNSFNSTIDKDNENNIKIKENYSYYNKNNNIKHRNYIRYNNFNNKIFNLSSYRSSSNVINDYNDILTAEEIHFKAVQNLHEIISHNKYYK